VEAGGLGGSAGARSGSEEAEGCEMTAPFTAPKAAALALLNSDVRLTRKAGSFLGQTVADPAPLSQAQAEWLATLLDRAGLPPLEGGG
jgi:hypothetical protein